MIYSSTEVNAEPSIFAVAAKRDMKALFYTLGDKTHGMGHVTRCLTLSRALAEIGVASIFATAHETLGLDWLRLRGANVYDFHPDDLSWAHKWQADCVVIDLESGPTRAMLEAVRWDGHKIIVLAGAGWTLADEPAVREIADLLICQSILVTDDALSGTQYMIIDPAFAACQPDHNGHILVSFGGSDPHGLTRPAVEALAGSGRAVIAINGPAADDADWPAGVTVHHAPASLVPSMSGAAVFLGALGMTAYEAAAAGVPALLTGWSDDHVDTALELEKRGCAISLGRWDKFDARKAARAISDLLGDGKRWAAMSAAGKALIDGAGAARVAKVIHGLIA